MIGKIKNYQLIINIKYSSNLWSVWKVKNVSHLKFSSADKKESGSIPTKSNKSVKPTPEYSSENLSRMVSSWKENNKSTPDPELDYIYKPKDWVDIPAPVKREVPERQECPLKSSGSEDKESSEDCWESTEPLKKSTELSITDSTSPPRVTSSRTRPSWSKLSSRKKPKRSMPKNLKPNKMPEDKRTKTEEEEEPIRLRNFDLSVFKSFIHLLSLTF